MSFSQADMNNGGLKRIIRKMEFVQWVEYELSKNELIDGNDYVGLIERGQEPKTFFNIESKTLGGSTRLYQDFDYREIMVFSLADVEKTYKRQVYSFM